MLNTISGFLGADGGPAPVLAYESIATTTVGGGGSASITFSSIPSTYTHLQIRAISRQTSTGVNAYLQFNSDTSSANYTQHQLAGNGSTVSASATTTGTLSGAYLFYGASSSQGANVFGAAVIDILDYANTNKYKTGRSLSGYDNNGSGVLNLTSALWLSTSAISSITVLPQSANFAQYTQFALYGIK
jgi:hypothetical protein